MNEQQKHLIQMLDQQKTLVDDITILNNQLSSKKEVLFKIQGVIEYLEQIGVSLPKKDTKIEEEKEDKSED